MTASITAGNLPCLPAVRKSHTGLRAGVLLAEHRRQQSDLVSGGSKVLGPSGQGGGEAGVKQEAEALCDLRVVPLQQAVERLAELQEALVPCLRLCSSSSCTRLRLCRLALASCLVASARNRVRHSPDPVPPYSSYGLPSEIRPGQTVLLFQRRTRWREESRVK